MRRVFLTGASSGIGLAIAKALSERGDEVWGTSRQPGRIPQLPRVHAVRLDLSERNSIDQAFKSALSEAGHFDVVINNAGSGHFDAAEHLSGEEIDQQFQILVFGHLQLMRLAMAAMRARGKGLIINVTSLASRLPVPFMAAYNAAKAAIAAYTMSIQLELPDSEVRIVDLQPADISTAFNDLLAVSQNFELTGLPGHKDGFNAEALLDEGHEARDVSLVVLSCRAVNDLDLHLFSKPFRNSML